MTPPPPTPPPPLNYDSVRLPGAAGPIPALCVLPSWTDSAASTSGTATAGGGRRNGAISGVSPGFHDIGMMAMSSWKNTFIVGIYPEVPTFSTLLLSEFC